MMCDNGYIKLIDFGLSRVLLGDEMAMTCAGTAEYISPEMLNKNTSYDKSIDWWAVGIILYEMLTGRTPFFNKNRHHLNQNILKKPVKWSKKI